MRAPTLRNPTRTEETNWENISKMMSRDMLKEIDNEIIKRIIAASDKATIIDNVSNMKDGGLV